MLTPETLDQWRAACDGESEFHESRILALIDALEEAERQIDDHYDAARDRLRERDEALEQLRLMTREARLSREATEKAVAAVRAVRMLHTPEPGTDWCSHCWPGPLKGGTGSIGDDALYPCATLRALLGTPATVGD